MQEAGLSCPDPLIPDGLLHRFDAPGDKPKSRKGWYILFDSIPPAGSFGRWQGDCNNAVTWCGKVTKEFTPEEKREYARRMAEARKQQEAEQQGLHAECREKCLKIWNEAAPAKPDHPYLVRKQIQSNGARQFMDSLIIPLSANKTIQGIQFISPDGSKKFKTGTVKQGSCFLIGQPGPVVVVCEGFATGASIHEATNYPCLVAFDAGNLKAVVTVARERLPGSKVIVAADNDAWKKVKDAEGNVTEYQAAKPKENTGIIKAKEAGADQVIIPRFRSVETHPTDFNDLHCLEGLSAVADIFAGKEEEPPPPDDYQEPAPFCEYIGPADDTPSKYDVFGTAPFTLLGYDRGEYFYMADETGQVRVLTASEHSKANLITLAPLNWWEGIFSAGTKKTTGFDEDAAKNALIHTNHRRGVYDPENIRGLGAWDDDGRSVLHLGDVVSVDGRRVPLAQFKTQTQYIYERALKISDEAAAPLSAKEANKLVQLCDMLSWEKPINGKLLAGWCVAAIVCGALRWRPHLFLTGPSGTGKSWIISNVIKLICGNFLKGMLSSTTEPGLRRAVGNNAFSVFIDEFEAEDPEAAKRIQSILEFARPCSCNEDSKIYKAKQGTSGVDTYTPRACIGMAAVGVNLKQRADTSRVSVLSLVKGKEGFFDEVIEPFWQETFTREFAAGVRARAIIHIPTINKNAVVFQKAATKKLRGRREGDQYGVLLACCYSLYSNKEISQEDAQTWVDKQNWDGHIASTDQSDERRCLNVILEHIIRVESGASYNIAELINLADGAEMASTTEPARATLMRYGIKWMQGGFAISNTHSSIAKILEKTPWSANWGRILARLEGAVKPKDPVYISGSTARVVMLPLRYAKEE